MPRLRMALLRELLDADLISTSEKLARLGTGVAWTTTVTDLAVVPVGLAGSQIHAFLTSLSALAAAMLTAAAGGHAARRPPAPATPWPVAVSSPRIALADWAEPVGLE